jgi:hypothetical protein
LVVDRNGAVLRGRILGDAECEHENEQCAHIDSFGMIRN